MKLRSPLILLALAIPLAAEDPGPTFDLKVHSGFAAGDLQKLHANNKVFGLGVAGRFSTSANGAFTLELGFDILPGRDHDVMPTSGLVYYDPANPVTTYAGQPLTLSVTNSIDFRKESTQGFSLRGAYTNRLPGSDWYWFAGASLDFYKTTAQFTGTLVPGYGDPANPTVVPPLTEGAPDYYEGWAFVQDKTKLGIGFLGGVGVPLGENFKVEFTLRNLGFTHLDYRPFTYTGKPAALDESSKRGFTFEIGLSLKI